MTSDRRTTVCGSANILLRITASALLITSNISGAAVAAPSSAQAVDLYVLGTSYNGTQPCTPLSAGEEVQLRGAIFDMASAKLSPVYDVMLEALPNPINILKSYSPPAVSGGVSSATVPPINAFSAEKPNIARTPSDIQMASTPDLRRHENGVAQIAQSARHVIIATYCKMYEVYSLSLAGYTFSDVKAPQLPKSGSLSGSFDALASANWSNLFGTAPLFATVAFVPLANDSTNVINTRLIRNLPFTAIATPAPAPAAPASPPVPSPPTTRLEACQDSAYRILVTGRTTSASQTTDLIRLLVAGSALKFSGSQPWPTIYTIATASLGILYIPNSAEAGVDVFTCPQGGVYKAPGWHNFTDDSLFWVGGYNAHIVGHKTSSAIGTDSFVQQRTLDAAILDLENQLDCVISHKLAEMQVRDALGAPLMDETLSQADRLVRGGYGFSKNPTWCSDYISKLEHHGTTLGNSFDPDHIYWHGDLLLNYHKEGTPKVHESPINGIM